ncbi:MAG: PTS sugar transporter subunit IIA [Tissierellaceae bacterium]|nr:PTS sugar transporter subunit IIA [Tissierellaceae bacterium]
MESKNMFFKEAIFLDIEAKSTDDVLDYVYNKLHSLGYVTEEFRAAVKEREKKYPTGLPGPIYDIAVPHTDPDYIVKPFIAVARTKEGIPFVQMGTRDLHLKTRIVFVLGFKTGKYQVKILQTLVDLFIQGTMAEEFMKVNDEDEALELLKNIKIEGN